MKIAVTFKEGNVFKHFGRTQQFKIYEATGKKVTASSILNTNGKSHHELVGFLKDNGAEVLICGGLGEEVKDAIKASGIEVISGADGDTDKAVQGYLDGTLKDQNILCSGHDIKSGEAANCTCHDDKTVKPASASECTCHKEKTE